MNEHDIFLAALDIEDPVERATYINQACAGDSDLRRQIESLLSAHGRSGEFLDVPALQQIAIGPAEVQQSTDETIADHDDGQADADLSFLLPSTDPTSLGRLGHYEIREVIGRGGCGIVLKAFDETLHRIVAIKGDDSGISGHISCSQAIPARGPGSSGNSPRERCQHLCCGRPTRPLPGHGIYCWRDTAAEVAGQWTV